MKAMDKKELLELGKDLKMAKILVLKKHGFSSAEIASALDIPESRVRALTESSKAEV